jgi:hypothetical protein
MTSHSMNGQHYCTSPGCKRQFDTAAGQHFHERRVHGKAHDNKRLKKIITISMPPQFVQTVDDRVSTKGFSSRSAFIEHAVRAYVEFMEKTEAV